MTLSRRGLLWGAGVLALTACTPAAPALIRPSATPSGPVRERLQALADAYAANTDKLGLSVTDLRTNATFSFRGDFDTQSASIAKVMISLLALRKARSAGEELSFENYGRISKAIRDSDNDSADQLWEWVGGGAAYDALASDLGLAHTHSDPRSTFWSWTNTTPDDQRLLMHRLATGTKAIHADDRLYLLELMGKTNPSQTWGVGHDKGGKVAVSMKNGWVQFKSLDNLWAVNSIGRVSGEGRDYVAAIMCRMPSFDEGRALVDALGADLFAAMGSGTLS
ncbi:MAG: serine hydrolase [Propioniciclava sp.]|uniref:serine hydrolase n=1 Tax=Propioniciclava sp. TaxID=2038686 RepID=UPI0039E63E52